MNLCLNLCEKFSCSASPKALLQKKRDEISFVLLVRGEDGAWGVCVFMEKIMRMYRDNIKEYLYVQVYTG